MNTFFKLFCLFAAFYIVWQLGRVYGRTEVQNIAGVGLFDNRLETYNEIMLRNCLKEIYEKNK